MPLRAQKFGLWPCCCKLACDGCIYANIKSNGGDIPRCPFCREPLPDDDEEKHKKIMKRIKANDPAAMREMGADRYNEGNCDSAFEYWTKAAELGDEIAHYRLGSMYRKGEGVEKDEEKAVYHWEKAAIGGHPFARHNLGCVEGTNGNAERAAKHFIIAANLGWDESMKQLWLMFKHGNMTKEDLDATLRTHQAALDEMKSPERWEADKILD
jgi:TPR repeat protein